MNAVAPRRNRNLAKSLEVIAEFVSTDPAEAPVEFVRDLARCWKGRGGLVAGKPRHSDRYLDDLLRLLGSPIRSLTPKLGGRTNLRDNDANILVRVFLGHWTYVGDEAGGGAITAPSPDLYEAMLPGEEDIAEVAAYVAKRIKAVGTPAAGVRAVDTGPASALPGEDIYDLQEREFREADAMFVVSAGQTMLVPQRENALIGFRDLMNRLWEVEKTDPRGRMMVWMLELGRQRFEDLESRTRFMNVQQVLARFTAIKRFREGVEGLSEARWNWLRSNAVIVLHDTNWEHPPSAWLPAFDAHHVLFSAVPVRWVNSRSFQTLYGEDGHDETSEDRMWTYRANYTIYLKKAPESTRDALPGARQRYRLRYFGNAVLKAEEKSNAEIRSLELIPPGESYTEALGTVYMAAAQLLGLSGVPPEVSIDKLRIDQAHAMEKLQHHGFVLLTLDRFMTFLTESQSG